MSNVVEILISNKDGIYNVKVNGRATFECVQPLRTLASELEQNKFDAINVDLGNCVWMDSTFMGMIGRLGLHAIKHSAERNICNAGEQNTSLLCGLGLKKVFKFIEAEIEAEETLMDPTATETDRRAAAQNVLDAHKTLIEIDLENEKKFKGVVDMIQKDIDKMDTPKG